MFALLAGCGSSVGEGSSDAGADAGPHADAGSDGGALPDAGEPDAGIDGGADAGEPDAGSDAGADAGEPDAGSDAGEPDAGEPDGGADAGEPDAGMPDAGQPDAGPACSGDEKLCDGGCVSTLDPGTGCAQASCDPCTTTEAHAAVLCAGGACAASCTGGYQDCNRDLSDGCEANVEMDPANCGACGNVCSAPHASMACAQGACAISACSSGYANCDGAAANGCESNLGADTRNCGTCGNQCNTAHGTPSCLQGACATGSCDTGYQDCDGLAANGCETNVASDANNCGGCGNACAAPHASTTCAQGSCAISSCSAGYANCDRSVSDGCETNIGSDANNCGGCGHQCLLTHATAACTGGTCAVAACSTGWADCNHTATDGCEANTDSDPNNCGGCGHVCVTTHGVAGCVHGTCTTASCTPPYADCNGNPADGCETNLANDVNNCGSCGDVCASACGAHVTGTRCSSATCQITACAPGYSSSNMSCSAGCR